MESGLGFGIATSESWGWAGIRARLGSCSWRTSTAHGLSHPLQRVISPEVSKGISLELARGTPTSHPYNKSNGTGNRHFSALFGSLNSCWAVHYEIVKKRLLYMWFQVVFFGMLLLMLLVLLASGGKSAHRKVGWLLAQCSSCGI